MAELDGHGGVLGLLGALPAHAFADCVLRENVLLDQGITVLQGVTVSIASGSLVNPAVTGLAFGASGGGAARSAVVHARGAVSVVIAVVSVQALLADTLSAAHQAVGATVLTGGTAGSVIKDLVVVTASFA